MVESRPRFPIARKLIRFAGLARQNWLLRHQNPANFAIHMLGIPVAVFGLFGFAFLPWLWALGCFIGGYFLQWVGHCIEGNDVGELIPIKKMLGLKTISIAPQFLPPSAQE